MADSAKYSPINGGALISDLKTHFSMLKTKKTKACAFAFVSVFIAFSVFLAFSPSPYSSSPWFTNIFSLTSTRAGNISANSSIFSHFSPNFSQQAPSFRSQNSSSNPPNFSKVEPLLNQSSTVNAAKQESLSSSSFGKNQTQSQDFDHKVGLLKANQTQNTEKVEPLKPLNQSSTVNASKQESFFSSSSVGKNLTQNDGFGHKVGVLKANQTQNTDKVEPLKPLNRSSDVNAAKQESFSTSSFGKNLTQSEGFNVLKANQTGKSEKNVKGVVLKNLTSSSAKNKKQNSDEDLVKSLLGCNFFDGNWVKDDESYPLYKPGSCSLIDEQFNCFTNGRPDNDYFKYRWKPKACSLPRLNGAHMLEMLRGKRLVFVGDSLNRNMWESLVCILRNSVKDQKKVYEEFGRHHFRGEASYSFVFEEYKCKVEFFVSPFLVQEWEVADKNGMTKETLRLDLVGQSAEKYKNADVLVFNTGHWWTHEKTSKGKDYYQEGSHVYSDLNVLEAFRKALTTWGRWVDAHINPSKTFVLFRGYSASHFSGGQWNSGGACDHETEPIKNETYLTEYPPKMQVLERVLRGMKTKVSYLNITRMTDFRKDGHPSMYRKQKLSDEERRKPLMYQDCSHWCLPGVPDAWNELLYAKLLVKQYQERQDKKS